MTAANAARGKPVERKRRDRPADRAVLDDWLFALRTAYVAGRFDGADPFAPAGLAEIDATLPDASHHSLPTFVVSAG